MNDEDIENARLTGGLDPYGEDAERRADHDLEQRDADAWHASLFYYIDDGADSIPWRQRPNRKDK